MAKTMNLLIISRVIFSIIFFITLVNGNYEKRYWTYQGKMIQSVNVYSRSPFVMYGRGYQLVLSGYDRDAPTMYIDYRYEYEGIQQAWSVHATMSPEDVLPAIVDTATLDKRVLYEGSKYGHWIAAGGTFETKPFFAVSASYDPYVNGTQHRFNDSGSVYIYHGAYSRWTETQKLRSEPIVAGTFFGTCVSICPKNPHIMVIGSEGEQAGTGIFQAGAAFIYRSNPEATKWSVTQRLLPEAPGFKDRFGFITKIYDDFLLVSSQFDDDNGVDTGSVYIFREERATGLNLWSQQQKLYSHVRSNEFGEFSEIYGHTLVVGSNQEDDYGGETNTGAVYVYKTFPTLEPPYIPPPHNHDDDGHPRKLSEGDDALVPKPKPPPPRVMFKWWSFQQRLLARDWHIHRFFGTYVSLGGDGRLIATGAFGEAKNDTDWTDEASPHYRTGSSYMFVKHQTEHKWTQQQKFLGPNFPKPIEYYSDPYLHGSDLIIRDTESGFVYSDKFAWDCLQIAVSDHFGDGWDNAFLMAYAPGSFTKVSDHYTPYCSSPNPLKFRYCPLLDEDIGEYVFKLSDDVFTRKFWPEIRWSIKNEKDNKWYYGDARTSIKFMWIQDRRQFDHVLDPADKLFVNDRCVACSPDLRPKPKPKGDRRVLKSGDDGKSTPKTHTPTVSPAPTVVYDPLVEDWARLEMATTDPQGWYGLNGLKNGTGTSYYIYDSEGKVLIYTGTICGTLLLTGHCRIELEDGDYILRIGGALDTSATGHTWEFCGIAGGPQEMVTFSVRNAKCTPYTRVHASDYCLSNYQLALVAAGTIQLEGVSTYSLTEGDFEIIGEAIKVVTSVHVSKVTIELLVGQGVYPVVKFLAYIDPSNTGLSSLDSLDSFTLFDLFANEIETMSNNGVLTANIIMLSQMSHTDSSTLLNLQSAHITSVLNAGPSFKDLISTTFEPINFVEKKTGVSSSDAEPKPTKWDKFLQNVLMIDSNLGFVALAVVAFITMGVVWRLSVRNSIRQRESYSPIIPQFDDSSEPLISATPTFDPSSSSPPSSPSTAAATSSSASSTSTSFSEGRLARSREVMSAFIDMKDDLKKMADLEDEALPHQVDHSLNLLSTATKK